VIESPPARTLSTARPAGRASILAIVGLGVAAATTAVLTGGVASPMAVWCLAPLVAAVGVARGERLALGAAVSLAAVGVTALGGLTVSAFVVRPAVAPVLTLFALASTVLGLAAALVVMQRELGREDRRQRQALAHLRRVLEEQPFLLVSMAANGDVARTWGQEPAGARGVSSAGGSIVDLAREADRGRLREALARAAFDGAAEVGFAPSAEPQAWLSLVLKRTESGRLVGALRDAGAAHARELELEQARSEAEAQNAGKSRFLANMSHELRTPLNAIMGFSDIMRQRLFGPLSDRYAEYAELVHESGGHLLDLINDVLDMSKIEAERFELAREPFDARDAVSSVLRLMRGQADRAGVQLRGLLPRESLDVVADRRALKQIALNLISNALKFTPRGGGVTVTLHADGSVMELIVADTGVGIGPEDVQRLGRPFEQAGGAAQKAAGTGLGLSLVRSFAELHGGEMVMESRLGEGTTVTVRLPVIDQPQAANEV
jgi:cell cycle sensor histidine kinase DivJ